MRWSPRSLLQWVPGQAEAPDMLVLAAVTLLPWAFGGVEIWAYRSAALLLVCAAGLLLARDGWAGLGLDRRARWLLPAALLACWAAVQIVPLPPPVIRLVSPTADALYRDTFPGYPGAPPDDLAAAIHRRALERVPELRDVPLPERDVPTFEPAVGGRWSGWRTISLLPSAGLERLLWYVALLLGFLVVRARCGTPEVARLYRYALFALFLALAVFGLLYAATSNGKIYWVRETIARTRPFGPYVNPTNFAGVMELAVPWMLGYLLLTARIARGARWSVLRSPVIVAATVLGALAALATASKSSGVMIAAACLLLVLLAVRRWWTRLLVFGGAAGIAAAAWPLLQGTILGERFEQFLDITERGYGEVGRWVGWTAGLGIFRDYPWTGAGFGAFRDVFPRYMPAGEAARWAQLHNDYLEVLVEGGLVAAALVVWLGAGFLARVLRRRVRVAEGGLDLEAIGLLAGVALLAVHAGFDFNHQIPANALLWVTMAGIAVARGEAPEGRFS